jgi:hypothetical protein
MITIHSRLSLEPISHVVGMLIPNGMAAASFGVGEGSLTAKILPGLFLPKENEPGLFLPGFFF